MSEIYATDADFGQPDTSNALREDQAECKPEDKDCQHALISEKLEVEKSDAALKYLILPYKPNYLLAAAYNTNPNHSAYGLYENEELELDNTEIKFQLSVKTPLVKNIILDKDEFTFAMTLTSWWQAYNSAISAPFRETNYEPLILWDVDLSDKNLYHLSFFGLGFSHQSNGRYIEYSRSWNRIFARIMFEFENFGILFKPWYRIPEEAKTDIYQAAGDDNPDIEKYMGNFELMGFTKFYDNEIRIMLRNNLDFNDNKGAVQLDWTFPMLVQVRGYVQVFSGYGESLIDYDVYTNRIGLGFSLTRDLVD